MASLIETWKRWLDVPEKTGRSAKSDRKTASNGKEHDMERKTSAEKAVERLAERKASSHSTVQSVAVAHADMPEQSSLQDAEQKKNETELQAAVADEMPVLTAEEMKKIVEEALREANDTEEMKEYLAQRFSMLESHIMSVRNVQKQEMIAVAVREVREKVDLISLDTRKMGSMKVMFGISIGCNLITLAVLVAYVLHFI